MGALTCPEEFISSVVARRLFKALIIDLDNLLPELIPENFQSNEIIEGAEFKYLKKKVDAIDKEKMTNVIVVDVLMNNVDFISYEVKFEATQYGGCKFTFVIKYNLKPGAVISENQLKYGKANVAAMFKSVEAHLLANPDAYA
ncbi:hypothetical protein ACOSP7_007235 [Xanthoceras sorbifolium]